MDKPADTQYPVHPMIAERWSPRAFDTRPVSAEQQRALLEAARWTASCFNEQPWSFLVARRDETGEFERMLGCLAPKNQEWARNAGALILTVARQSFTHNDKPNRWAVHDVGQSAATLTVQASALGLRVHQMAGIDADRIRETYRIPDGFEVVTGIAIGYAGDLNVLPEGFREAETAPRQRKPQTEFVFSGSWGDPASW